MNWIAALVIAVPVAAQHEHPAGGGEHPTGRQSSAIEQPVALEHPEGHEHPVGSKPWLKARRKEYIRTVEDYVRDASSGGGLKVKDEKLGLERALKLVRIHKKKIVHLGDERFFACADFKPAQKGSKDAVDLDFYAAKDKGGWKIEKVLIHKVNGVARYTYNDKNEMVPVP